MPPQARVEQRRLCRHSGTWHPFDPMSENLLQTRLIGARVAGVERLDHTWFFRFDTGAQLVTDGLWRVLTQTAIATSSEDDGQMFGRKTPVDAAKTAKAHLAGSVAAVALDPITGDLTVSFDSGATLQMLNISSGYEGWRLSWPDGVEVIALGGGRVMRR
ncbi:MAG: hypothetical protein JSR45_16535 [Proteobacteria bacterium]|nr:hypothetical protein [Pseudomonadota bacterium]